MENIIKLIEDALKRVGDFFSLRFQDDKEMEELGGFLKEEQNRFNPDGTLTDEYVELIKKVEEKLTGDNLNELLIESAESPEERDAILSIIGFVEDRDKLMEDYRDTIIDYEGDTDAWVKDRATEGMDENAAGIRIKTLEETLASEDDIIDIKE